MRNPPNMPNEGTDKTTRMDRRSLIAAAGMTATALATPSLGTAAGGVSRKTVRTGFPHDTFRDWIRTLEDNGLLMRLPRLDQDAYEATALAYRLMDRFGWYGAPAVIADAMANPGRYYGWRYLLDPGKPESPANPRRVPTLRRARRWPRRV